MNHEFENEIKENKRAYRIEKLPSKSKDDLYIKKEENLIMKIWYLILFYDNSNSFLYKIKQAFLIIHLLKIKIKKIILPT